MINNVRCPLVPRYCYRLVTIDPNGATEYSTPRLFDIQGVPVQSNVSDSWGHTLLYAWV